MVICLLFIIWTIFPTTPSIFPCSEPPRFVSKLNSLTVVAGEPAELQASIEGTQPISVQWLKEKEEVLEKVKHQNYICGKCCHSAVFKAEIK